MGRPAKDLTDQVFTRLTILKRVENAKDNHAQWLCRCTCGREVVVAVNNLKSGNVKSCGCLKKENSHKNHHKPSNIPLEYKRLREIYYNIKQWCYNSNNPRYAVKGALGYTICEEWLKSSTEFCEWALKTNYSSNMTLAVDGKLYSANTCTWKPEIKYSVNVKDKFGKWEVIDDGKTMKDNVCICRCACGNESTIYIKDLIKEKSTMCKSCSTSAISTTHGLAGTRIYRIYQNMKSRCTNENLKDYINYGGRGITVCDRWLESFENFRDDMLESYNKHVEEFGENDTSIDRIDNSRGYLLENCKWATRIDQNNNTRQNHLLTFDNKTLNIKEWSDRVGIPYATLLARIGVYGWEVGRALTTPIKPTKK